MRSAAWLGFVTLLAVGCRSGGGATRGAGADASTSGDLSGGSFGQRAPARNEPDPMAVPLFEGHLLVDDAELAALPATREQAAHGGFDRRYTRGGPHDKVIVPLLERAKVAHHLDEALNRPSVAAIVAEPSTPYRILVEVLYTLGQAQVTSFHLVVLRSAHEPDAAAPAAALPPLGPLVASPAQRTKLLALDVSIGHDGVRLATADGPLGAGCAEGAPGVTVPKVGASQDLAGVQRCVFRLKSGSMADTSVTLAAAEDTDYATVLDTMDALRESGGDRLFPDVTFAAPR